MSARFETWPGERPETVGLEVGTAEWRSSDEAWSAIRALAGATGWVALTDRVVEWPDAHEGGFLLSAEVAVPDGTTLHVRYAGGIWRGYTLRERPQGELLCFRERFVGTVPGSDRKLAYAVYWRLEPAEDGVEVYRPYAARFTGWEER